MEIDPLHLPLQLHVDVAAGQIAGVMHRQTALDLLQAESQGLEPADEFEPPQALLDKQPVAAFAATDGRQQAENLVLTQGLAEVMARDHAEDLRSNDWLTKDVGAGGAVSVVSSPRCFTSRPSAT